jgi:hypothetical protein
MWGIIIWFISFHDGIIYFLTYFWYNLIPTRKKGKKGKIPWIIIAFVFPRQSDEIGIKSGLVHVEFQKIVLVL